MAGIRLRSSSKKRRTVQYLLRNITVNKVVTLQVVPGSVTMSGRHGSNGVNCKINKIRNADIPAYTHTHTLISAHIERYNDFHK